MRPIPCWFSVFLILLLACSDDGGTDPNPADTTPPAKIENLAVVTSEDGAFTLIWTASGDDDGEGQASEYDIRYATTSLSEATWGSAMVLDSPPVPSPAGEIDSVTVTGLSGGNWLFGLKVADEVPNWSTMSNVVSGSVADTIPPHVINDLAVGSRSASSITLTWTAPADNSASGNSSLYDLRYALMAITEETWVDAIRVEGEPFPASAGSTESYTVTGLETGRSYFFALKSADWVSNWSDLSNVVSASLVSLVRLTTGPSWATAYSPSWSPDGQTIAFTANWEDVFYNEIYLIQAGGGNPVQLTNIPLNVIHPQWSPDGTRLAIQTLRDVSGDLWRELSIIEPIHGALPDLLASHGTQRILAHDWSADGSRIAYALEVSRNPSVGEVRSIRSSGGNSDLIFRGSGIIGSLAWSADGNQIAFSSDRNGNSDIWVVPAGGGDAVQLTTDPASDNHPDWSLDGSQIAFASRRTGSYDIWLMSAAGENPTQLTTDPAEETDPSWSPDGSAITYTSSKDGNGDIWVLYLE